MKCPRRKIVDNKISYGIVVITKQAMQDKVMRTTEGTSSIRPELNPGGRPRVTEGSATVEVEVKIFPSDPVIMSVTKDGDGEMVGNAEALRW